MYYFVEKKEVFEKYLVIFDVETLEIFRKEIIDNCSMIEYCEYDGTYTPTNKVDYEIRNLSSRYVGVRKFRDTLQCSDEDMYHYSYDKYIYPPLVSYIDELLAGNVKVLGTKIVETDVVEIIKEKIRKVSKELDSIDNLDIENKKTKIEELQKLVAQAKLNENQKSVNLYLERLQNIVQLKLVDRITLEEVNRFNNFFENKIQSQNVVKQRKLKK